MSALSSGDLKKDYARFAVPTMLSLFIYAAYSMVDGVFVGHLVGQRALAAVNIGAPFLSVLFGAAVLLGVGGSTVIARLLGQGRQEEAGGVFTQCVLGAAIAGVLLGGAARLFLPGLCRILGATAETAEYTRQYVGTLALFAVSVLLEYNLEVLVKADGKPRLAAVTVALACTLHALLDWLFIGVLDFGVRGAAMATGLAETVAVCIFLGHFLFSKKRTLRFVHFRFDARQFGRIAVLGFPEAMTDLCVGILTWIYNRVVLRFCGTVGVAGFTVVTYVNTLVSYTLSGASQGLQPLVSYHRGRGDGAAVRKLLRCAIITALVAGTAFAALVELMPDAAVSVFIPAEESELHAFSVFALRRYALAFVLMGFNIVAGGFMTASEKPGLALGLSLGRGCVMPALALLVLTSLFGEGGIWWAAVTADVSMALIGFAVLRRNRGKN